jgi:hypothetical protein
MLTETDRSLVDITGLLVDNVLPYFSEENFHGYVWVNLRDPIDAIAIKQLEIGPRCSLR